MSEQGTSRVRHATRSKRHPVLLAFVSALAALVGFGGVFINTFKTAVEAQITTREVDSLLGDDRPAPALPPADGSSGRALNILLMGTDSRDGDNANIGGYEAGHRSDTTILMHISADRTRIELVSFPRDSMVQLAECTRPDGTTQRTYKGMFNEAFANGASRAEDKATAMQYGAACAMRTVESLIGFQLDHYAVVDFSGFVQMVDAVGGVPMCLEKPVKDKYTALDLPAGPQVLDGYTATQFARMRHGTGMSGSDLDRIDRQQQLLKNLARKVLGSEVLLNPADLTSFISATAQSLTMDPALGDLDRSVGLAFSLRNFDARTGLVMATVPVRGYPEDPNRVEFIPNKAKEIFAALMADQPIAPLLDSQSANPANEAPIGKDATTGTESPAPSTGPVRETEEEILAQCGV